MTNQSDNSLSQIDSPDSIAEEVGIRFGRIHFHVVLLIALSFMGGLISGYLIWGQRPSDQAVVQMPTTQPESALIPEPPQTQTTTPTTAPSASEEPVTFEVSVDDDPAIGPVDAPITIVEFADFNCGFCRVFFLQTLHPLLEAYPDQIHFVYRDLPLVGGYEAALAAECADEQGAFWEYHDVLFTEGASAGRSSYIQYAEDIGLDSDVLTKCLDEGHYAAEVAADAQFAIDLGATGVPLFFINGIPVVGAQPLEVFIQIIEAELEK